MEISREKQKKLAHVARRYYLEEQKQSEIARELGVSRPMISRMLSEARRAGVVEIRIHEPEEPSAGLLGQLGRAGWEVGGTLVEDAQDDRRTNLALARAAVDLLGQLKARRVGVGWGHFIGEMVAYLEAYPHCGSGIRHICPLMGNAGVPIRNYHPNENVRVLAQQLGAQPHFLYLPALPESLEEKQVLCSTELYHQIQQEWGKMDAALVNIGNYPSTPDFASVARYGDRLQKQRACGRLLAYYLNERGEIICSEQDFAIQIPLAMLKSCPNVVGVCSANVGERALRGALNTGYFTQIVARAEAVRALLGKNRK